MTTTLTNTSNQSPNQTTSNQSPNQTTSKQTGNQKQYIDVLKGRKDNTMCNPTDDPPEFESMTKKNTMSNNDTNADKSLHVATLVIPIEMSIKDSNGANSHKISDGDTNKDDSNAYNQLFSNEFKEDADNNKILRGANAHKILWHETIELNMASHYSCGNLSTIPTRKGICRYCGQSQFDLDHMEKCGKIKQWMIDDFRLNQTNTPLNEIELAEIYAQCDKIADNNTDPQCIVEWIKHKDIQFQRRCKHDTQFVAELLQNKTLIKWIKSYLDNQPINHMESPQDSRFATSISKSEIAPQGYDTNVYEGQARHPNESYFYQEQAPQAYDYNQGRSAQSDLYVHQGRVSSPQYNEYVHQGQAPQYDQSDYSRSYWNYNEADDSNYYYDHLGESDSTKIHRMIKRYFFGTTCIRDSDDLKKQNQKKNRITVHWLQYIINVADHTDHWRRNYDKIY
eukprot:184749_1